MEKNIFKIPEARVAEELARAEAESQAPEEAGGRFCPVSLGDWLELCRKAGVPHVPAEQVAEFMLEDIMKFDTPGEHQERLGHMRKRLEEARLQAHMVRLDCCASIEIKYRLSQGEWEWRPEFGDVILDDPRAFDILMEYPRPRVPVWRRPWADALVLNRYPVEYRAFVRDGKLQGISNYYPQRTLEEFPEHLQRVGEMAQALAEAVSTPFQWLLTPMPEGLDPAGVHFTADFIAVSGKVLFLEGGPPHEMGAHPCCFPAGEINGVALESRK